MNPELRTVRTEGLGDSTYVLAYNGIGLVVDPQRDIDRFTTEIESLDIDVRWILETHLHNDYVSGASDLAKSIGAELVIPAGAAPAYRHFPAFHNEEVGHGDLKIRPIHTPGHTPEHMSYLVLIDDEEWGVFSGGSLLVGSAGRSDLLGMERAESLARLQYQSVNLLASLPGTTSLYPTHGAGSFCTASGAGKADSTIAEEVATNPVLAHEDVESFVESHLSGLVPYPDYYRHMGPTNLSGLPAPTWEPLPTLSESEFLDLPDDVVVVDGRPKRDFASGHLRESTGIELRDDFGVWVGWVIPFDANIVVVLNPDQSAEEVQRQLVRIGFDHVKGVITDLTEWKSELVSYEVVGVPQFVERIEESGQVLDVRAPAEWEDGIIEGSAQMYAPDLAEGLPGQLEKDRQVLVACGTGYRATIAASFLERSGFTPVVLVDAGIPEVLSALK